MSPIIPVQMALIAVIAAALAGTGATPAAPPAAAPPPVTPALAPAVIAQPVMIAQAPKPAPKAATKVVKKVVKKAPAPLSFGFVQRSGVVAAGNNADLWFEVKNSTTKDRYVLQRKVAGKWVRISSPSPFPGNSWGVFSVSKSKATTEQFRMLRERSGKAAGTTPVLNVRFGGSAKAVVPTYPVMEGIRQSEKRIIKGKTVAVDVSLAGTGTIRTGTIQVNSKGKWKKVATLKLKNSSFQTTGRGVIPRSNHHGKLSYRVVIDAKAGSKALTQALTVEHVDPLKYTGVKKSTHQWTKKWCSDVLIDTHSNTATSYAYSNPERISMSTKLDPSWVGTKYVAYHECAHILQYRAYKNRVDHLVRDANKLHGTNGVERQADCMAGVMGMAPITKQYRSVYETKCSAQQVAAAKKIVGGKPVTTK